MVISPGSEYWTLQDDRLLPARYLSHWSTQVPTTRADLDLDGIEERLAVQSGQAAIFEENEIAWLSPEDWTVQQAEMVDFNQDGTTEIALIVWRPFESWPIDSYLPNGGRISSFQDISGNSCHLILVGWRRGKYQELWAGSALAEPIRSFAAADLDGDGDQELIVLEGNYSDTPGDLASALAVWEWNGFGFSLVARREGPYKFLEIVSYGSQYPLILTTPY